MNQTMMKRVGTTLKGVISGAFIGLFLGVYISNLTIGYVIQSTDYVNRTMFEMAESRFSSILILSFVTILTLIGPYVASTTFGPWPRHALYGLLGGVVLVVGIALLGAFIQGERPFYGSKLLAEQTWIDAARGYGIPAAFVVGPIVGILIGRLWLGQPKFKDSQ